MIPGAPKFFRNLPMRLKLMLLMMGTAMSAIVVMCALFSVRYVHESRQAMQQEMGMLAQVIGDRSTAALIFLDNKLAAENLAALSHKESIQLACIYDAQGNVFARYANMQEKGPDCPAAQNPSAAFDGHEFHLNQNIMQASQRVGGIYLRAGLNEIESNIAHYGTYVALLMVLAGLFSYLLAMQLHHVISDPVARLVNVTQKVTKDSDYSQRAVKESDDEMGQLIDAFNAMLGQIAERDEALVRSRDVAEAANRAKSEFLANMNHELRTPLNAIIGFSEIIKNEVMGPLGNTLYGGYVKDIYASGTHLLNIINDILDYSKLEAGHDEVKLNEVDITRTIRKMLRLMAPRAGEGGIELHRVAPEAAVVIYADERKLKQVLLNLLTNSVKFTKPGGHITVEIADDAVSDRITIRVRDTGIGIAAEDIPKSLAPFGQVESALNRHYEGTGLGLPLSKKFVEVMDGEFLLESEPGEGTVVTFTLPGNRTLKNPS